MTNRTHPTGASVEAFIEAVTPEARRAEARRLDAIFREVSGFAPVLWPSGLLGYGRYRYVYDSGRSGMSLATGFAPRAREISVHIMPGYADFANILAGLGPHWMGKSCLYIRRLDRIDEGALRRLIRAGLDDLARRWEIQPS